jgi:hypothetical protein
MTDITETEHSYHPLALVDHRQPADLQLLHVPHRFGKVFVLTAAMEAVTIRRRLPLGRTLLLELIALTLVAAVAFLFVQHGVPYFAEP